MRLKRRFSAAIISPTSRERRSFQPKRTSAQFVLDVLHIALPYILVTPSFMLAMNHAV